MKNYSKNLLFSLMKKKTEIFISMKFHGHSKLIVNNQQYGTFFGQFDCNDANGKEWNFYP